MQPLGSIGLRPPTVLNFSSQSPASRPNNAMALYKKMQNLGYPSKFWPQQHPNAIAFQVPNIAEAYWYDGPIEYNPEAMKIRQYLAQLVDKRRSGVTFDEQTYTYAYKGQKVTFFAMF